MTHLRDCIISYVKIVVNDHSDLKNQNNEVLMIEIMEKYGWSFPYIPPSAPTKAELETISKMKVK